MHDLEWGPDLGENFSFMAGSQKGKKKKKTKTTDEQDATEGVPVQSESQSSQQMVCPLIVVLTIADGCR
jgi:hypothetical protein